MVVGFRLCCSELGSLLGAFGKASQYNAIMKVWKKSTVPCPLSSMRPVRDVRCSYMFKYGITQRWSVLQSSIDSCCCIEDIVDVETRAFDILYSPLFKAITRTLVESDVSKDITKKASSVAESVDRTVTGVEICDRIKRALGSSNSKCIQKLFDDIGKASGYFIQIQSRAACAYGRNCETTSIDKYNTVHQESITSYKKLHKKTVYEDDAYKWTLEGYIDGKIQDNIVEIKHRKKLIQSSLPKYDELQIHGYMFLHDKRQVYMLQCIQRRDVVYQERTCVPFNVELWDTLVNDINRVLSFIVSLRENGLAQDCFFRLPVSDREDMIDKYTKSSIFSRSQKRKLGD